MEAHCQPGAADGVGDGVTDKTPTSQIVRNERTKLLASALNTLGTTTIASALILPAIASAYRLTHPLGALWPVIGIVWLGIGVALHVLAQIVLGRLIP